MLQSNTTIEDQKLALSFLSDIKKELSFSDKQSTKTVQIKLQQSSEYLTIPTNALHLLVEIMSNMAEGKSITIVPTDSELTTKQAADLLNVSRPFVTKLLKNGLLPHRKVGSHRRILLKDVLDYDAKMTATRTEQLERLAQDAQHLNLGY